ncbi:hypothetical protein H5410_035989 [Solanum commersonii]|uniref:Uncharacterized protein n=1 Tax=Solanum commersonii TaxID=4109 RepID=A0A9J5Y3F9_SOLCO|nr:hypothetical protein H5410_035989 [Solanum commersonii]
MRMYGTLMKPRVEVPLWSARSCSHVRGRPERADLRHPDPQIMSPGLATERALGPDLRSTRPPDHGCKSEIPGVEEARVGEDGGYDGPGRSGINNRLGMPIRVTGDPARAIDHIGCGRPRGAGLPVGVHGRCCTLFVERVAPVLRWRLMSGARCS